ncbi:MAG: hypothetical protein JO023_00350 [Chloroflexi bacterium]|nr:hypothetical protein [Chloroflexota bacterium]
MTDFIIKTGDMIQITIPSPAIIPSILAPVPLVGTGAPNMTNSMPICVVGDELPPVLRAPVPYTAPPFVTPGMGTLNVIITPGNQTLRMRVGGKPALIKGSTFMAQFAVTIPAMQPTPGGPVPDPLVVKPGQAQFITTTANARAG